MGGSYRHDEEGGGKHREYTLGGPLTGIQKRAELLHAVTRQGGGGMRSSWIGTRGAFWESGISHFLISVLGTPMCSVCANLSHSAAATRTLLHVGDVLTAESMCRSSEVHSEQRSPHLI